MGDKKPASKSKGKGKRGVAVGLGLTAASMLAVQQADAASEIAQLAGSDNRLSILATLFVPAIGWVLFNIGAPQKTHTLPAALCTTLSTPFHRDSYLHLAVLGD